MKNNATYLTDMTHPLVRSERERFLAGLGLRYDTPMTEQQRRDFDRVMLAKYSKRFPPPPRTQWVLLGWAVVEQAVANGIIKDG
jgi:hypothetical protein